LRLLQRAKLVAFNLENLGHKSAQIMLGKFADQIRQCPDATDRFSFCSLIKVSITLPETDTKMDARDELSIEIQVNLV
jgi:hypothetical protein